MVLAQRLVFELAFDALRVATPTEEHLAGGSARGHRLEQAWRNSGHGQAEFLEQLRQADLPVIGDLREALGADGAQLDGIDAPGANDLQSSLEV